MAETVEVDVVRVFTDAQGGHGNELGIIASSVVSYGREQMIAALLGFSETVFVDGDEQGPAENRVTRIRIFTPVTELPFAGHPSVGTGWWLAWKGTPAAVLREKAGDVTVTSLADATWITAYAAWGPEYDWIPTASAAEVDALDAGSFTGSRHYAYAWIDQAAGHLRSRMFSPAMGIDEDEATGAAAIRVTARLARDLRITQGAGSELLTALIEDDLIRLGGRTVFDRTVMVTL
ncbi:PhzF family phenazine biosynthesis protein [Arthrobacter sp. H14-L1]|uniref:PhzF family phenazine biosynthesis protein n=1 Tax=Arthrobacter sp. H14-L1 TaxID=2996697 RepID=UPI00226FAA6F|nr:PhzF family phenazine biosynthesis protein [Arthrobacter sp. H14-L1]MCY0905539.1 PhzF family phenazine biosynthesis protein [Arthrobacter sp. H14-L1]